MIKMNEHPFTIVIPAFNEKKNIGYIIQEIKKQYKNSIIIVVDDGSIDNTATIAKEKGAYVAKHIYNLGQWAALKTGFTIAKYYEPSIIVSFDADGQHLVKDIGEIIKPIIVEDFDIVIGSRFLSYNSDMPQYRYHGIHFFNYLMKKTTGHTFSDCTCGFKAYKKEKLMKILPHINENQYGALESLTIAVKMGFKITEVPITCNPPSKSTKGSVKYGYHLIRTVFNPNNINSS
jgi:glycosyltransferase involved in cell wall biosynthesis